MTRTLLLMMAVLFFVGHPMSAQLFSPDEDKKAKESVSSEGGLVLEDGVELQITPRLVGVVPTLISSNLSRSRDFYTRSLGFSVVLSEGKNYMALGRDTIQLGIGLNPTMTTASRNSVYINVSGIDALYAEFKKKGVTMTKDIATQPSKMREFTLLDPDKNTLMFGEYLGN